MSACKKDNLDVIVVVLGATTKKMRTTDSVKILNYVFNNYSSTNIESIIRSSFSDLETHFSNNITIKKSTDKATLELEDLGNTLFPLSIYILSISSNEHRASASSTCLHIVEA